MVYLYKYWLMQVLDYNRSTNAGSATDALDPSTDGFHVWGPIQDEYVHWW